MVGLCQSVTAQGAVAPTKYLSLHMSPRVYSYKAVTLQWWKSGERQYACLNELWTHESHWNPKAKNPTSTAYGIPQFLNQTWLNYHYPVRPKDPIVQVQAGLRYITARYGSPCNAWAFWQKRGYY